LLVVRTFILLNDVRMRQLNRPLISLVFSEVWTDLYLSYALKQDQGRQLRN